MNVYLLCLHHEQAPPKGDFIILSLIWQIYKELLSAGQILSVIWHVYKE